MAATPPMPPIQWFFCSVSDDHEVVILPELIRLGDGQHRLVVVDQGLGIERLSPLRDDLIDLSVHLDSTFAHFVDRSEVLRIDPACEDRRRTEQTPEESAILRDDAL